MSIAELTINLFSSFYTFSLSIESDQGGEQNAIKTNKVKKPIDNTNELMKKLDLTQNDIVEFSLEDDFIKVKPVQVESRYTPEELKAMDDIVEKEKKSGKRLKAGKKFEEYIRKI